MFYGKTFPVWTGLYQYRITQTHNQTNAITWMKHLLKNTLILQFVPIRTTKSLEKKHLDIC